VRALLALVVDAVVGRQRAPLVRRSADDGAVWDSASPQIVCRGDAISHDVAARVPFVYAAFTGRTHRRDDSRRLAANRAESRGIAVARRS
jgi:hypothetical protein